MGVEKSRRQTFTLFMEEVQERVRHALVAAYGRERGREAAASAFAYAWEHWDRIEEMDNAAGYIYRVGDRIARRLQPLTSLAFPPVDRAELPWVEPELPVALGQLTERQRVSVVLVHGYGVPLRHTADLLGISPRSVRRHVELGLAKLRKTLGVEVDA